MKKNYNKLPSDLQLDSFEIDILEKVISHFEDSGYKLVIDDADSKKKNIECVRKNLKKAVTICEYTESVYLEFRYPNLNESIFLSLDRAYLSLGLLTSLAFEIPLNKELDSYRLINSIKGTRGGVSRVQLIEEDHCIYISDDYRGIYDKGLFESLLKSHEENTEIVRGRIVEFFIYNTFELS